MSRSRRKTPIFGHTTAETDHPWKQAAARRLRHRVKQYLKTTLDGDRFAGKGWDLESGWSSAKGGKHWWSAADAGAMRKKRPGPAAFSYSAPICYARCGSLTALKCGPRHGVSVTLDGKFLK